MTTPEDRLESIDCRDLILRHFFAVTAVAFLEKVSRSCAVSFDPAIFKDYLNSEGDDDDGVLSVPL